jgi:hypothetical protein
MQSAAEVGAPGVLLLLSFFVIAVLKLWPVARARPTPENRYEVAVASGAIMCIAGFAVAGQFVSLGGLETPYYVTMVGVALLKGAVPASVRPAAAPQPIRTVIASSGSRALAGPARPAVGAVRHAPIQRT